MKMVASELYNVAWFKLADFVARGEKERALTVHKLLMHSVIDEAISYQLEGDILLAFDDDAALDKYHVAANLYKKAGKIKQAASVYEHVCMFKEDEQILEALFDVHLLLKDYDAILNTFFRLSKVCLQNNNVSFITNLFHRHVIECDEILQALLHVRFVRMLLVYDIKNPQLLVYVYQAIDVLQKKNQEEELIQLLSLLEEFDKESYQKVQQYLETK